MLLRRRLLDATVMRVMKPWRTTTASIPTPAAGMHTPPRLRLVHEKG